MPSIPKVGLLVFKRVILDGYAFNKARKRPLADGRGFGEGWGGEGSNKIKEWMQRMVGTESIF